MRGTASLVSPSELPAAMVRVTSRGGPGPPLGLAARLGIRVQPERSSGTCILWAVSASPSEVWPSWVGPTFTCRRLSHFGLPRAGPSYLLEGIGPVQEEVAADAIH